MIARHSNPKEYGQRIKDETARYRDLIHRIGASVE